MSDGFTLDFTEVTPTSFEALPTGWYLCDITDANDMETKNPGKLPIGTPGTNWEFTIAEGDYENRRLWTNHWHHPNTLGFMMTMLIACGAYTKEQLQEASGLDVEDARDQAMNQRVWVKAKFKPAKGEYPEGNDIQSFKSIDNPPKQSNKDSGGDSLMP